MTRNESAEFYVNGGKEEVVKETANFKIIRSGDLLVRDNRRNSIYRSTEELEFAGIIDDHVNESANSLQALENSGALKVLSRPSFKVIAKDPNYKFEQLILNDLSDAEEFAEELELGIPMNTYTITRLPSLSEKVWNELTQELDKIVSNFDNIEVGLTYKVPSGLTALETELTA